MIQIARSRGIEVIGTASQANQEYLRSLGAQATTYGPGLASRVRNLAPHGVDGALHLAGTGLIEELIELTGEPTKVLSLADYGAAAHGALLSERPIDPAVALAQAAHLASTGALRIPVQEAFTLDTAAQAQDTSHAGHVVGKLVISVS